MPKAIMPEPKLDAVGCGSMVVDLFYRTPRIIRADEKVVLDASGANAEIERAAIGGVVLNHLGWARILGLEVGIFGKMGNDRHGDFLRDGMDRFGVRHNLTLDGSASSFATVFVDGDGNRAIYMMRGATAELTAAEVRKRHSGFIRRAHLVTTEISQLPLPTVIAILTVARDAGITTILDVDVPPSDAIGVLGTRAQLERAMKLATILKPAKAAAREIVGAGANGRDALKTAELLRSRYKSRAVALTDGDRGCAIATESESIRVPAFKIRQVDSTGAGDAFLGAMIAGLRWNLKWPEIGRLGNAAGAVCAARLGAFPSGFELRREILKLYGSELPAAATFRPTQTRGASRMDVDAAVELERFLEVASTELEQVRDALDRPALLRAAEMIRAAEGRGGRVHVTGVGKPEHVARYAASLLCSVGTPATFLHATETLHGSLGQVHPRDIVIAISNSGDTSELCATADAIKECGARLIAITGNASSELAQIADLVILAPVKREGGVLGLAPRASVMAQVFVVAALSVALEAARGLTLEEYSRWHRAGTLGEAARRLVKQSARKGGIIRLAR